MIPIRLILVLLSSILTLTSAAEPTRHALSFEEVQAGGELEIRMERNYGRLHAKRYTESILFTQTADPKWPGDYEGRTALALILDAQALAIDSSAADSLMSAFPKHYNKDGYFGTIHLPDVVDEQQLSSHGWTLRALCEYYHWRKKPETKAQIVRIVENLILPTKGAHKDYPLDAGSRKGQGKASGHTVGKVGKWNLSTDIGCDFIFFDGVVQAYEVTRDERLVPVIEELNDLFNRMDVIAINAQTHATLSGVRAVIRWHELSGKPELLAKAAQVFDTYLQHGCTENFENYNWFGRPGWTEPCAIVDSYLAACQLWQHSGEPRYLETAQQIYFNAICATQRSNGGWGLNNCSGSAHTYLCTSAPEAYWCCSMRGAEGLAAAARYSTFKNDDGLWFATFMNQTLDVSMADGRFKLVQESLYPFGESTRLKIKSAPAKPIALRFFTPSYLEPTGIKINGKKADFSIEKGFAVTQNTWKKGDVIEFHFRAKLQRETRRNPHSIQDHDLIRSGPLLMSALALEQSDDKDKPPASMPLHGKVTSTGPGKATLGEVELRPVYHLLDPDFDNLEGSWRQMLFPQNGPKSGN